MARINSHKPKDKTCYFITLHYYNDCIPYVRRDDLLRLSSLHSQGLVESYTIPVYRDSYIQRGFGTSFRVRRTKQIGILEDVDPTLNIQSLPGIKYNANKSNEYVDYSKVSISFVADWQQFVKRLRVNLQRAFQKVVPIDFFYAPEYGPTTQRFHSHCLIWFPSSLSIGAVKYHILKAWPFCDKSLLYKYIQVARCAAHYVSSYVNCGPDVSPSLLQLAPLKPTHSLGLGFENDVFGFSDFVEKFRQFRCVTFDSICLDSNGVPQRNTVLYPQYVLYRFLPRIKGYGRLSYASLRNFYLNVEKHCRPLRLCNHTVSGIPLYQIDLYDVYGIPIEMTLQEIRGFRKRFEKFLERFSDLGLDRSQAFELLYDYYCCRSSYIYKSMFDLTSNNVLDNVLIYFNLPDVVNGLPAPTVEPYLDDVSLEIGCNALKFVFDKSNQLAAKYYENIKYRKLNSF